MKWRFVVMGLVVGVVAGFVLRRRNVPVAQKTASNLMQAGTLAA